MKQNISALNLGEGWTTVIAPATVANVGPGFDILGIGVTNVEDVGRDSLTFLGDTVHIRRTNGTKPLVISGIYVNGVLDHSLTTNVNENVVGVAAQQVLLNEVTPLEIILEKMPFRGSGMGSSAASAVAGAYAALVISGREDKRDIAEIVVKSEVGKHPDNVLPALFGGVVASYGLTDDLGRLETLYDTDIMALKEAICVARVAPLGKVVNELSTFTDSNAIQTNMEWICNIVASTTHYNGRYGQLADYKRSLVDALKEKAEIYDSKAIKAAAKYVEECKEGIPIKYLKELGIKQIETDIARTQTYLKRWLSRSDSFSAEEKTVKRARIVNTLEKELASRLMASAPASINLDYHKLAIPGEVIENIYFVLVKPDVSISTVEARKRINRTPELGNVVANTRSLTKLVSCLYEGNLHGFGEAVCEDRIVEPARAPLIPGYANVKAKALELGAYGFNISGSGPTCFAVTDDIEKARIIAQGCMSEFSAAGSQSSAYICKVDMEGTRVLK